MAKAPRKPRKTAKAEPSAQVASLLPVLEFCAVAAKDIGEPFSTHLYLGYGWAMGFNGITAAARKIAEDINAAPHAFHLIDALKRAKGSVTMTLEGHRLIVKADKFRCAVECFDVDAWPILPPDPPVAKLAPSLMAGFACVAPIASDTAQTALAASVLLRSGSIVATDRHIMVEFWHGIDLPEIAIPKAFVAAIIKAGVQPTEFGFSQSSATFYLEDGSWLRSQLYSEAWPPNWERILPTDPTRAKPLPPGFWEAFDAVVPFADKGFVYCGHDKLQTSPQSGIGAEYDCPGIAAGPCLAVKRMEYCRPRFTTYDFSLPDRLFMFGENLRGAMVITSPVEVAEESEPEAPAGEHVKMEARQWSSDPGRLASAGPIHSAPIPPPAGQWVSGITIDDDIPF